jgi:hypothetical protein
MSTPDRSQILERERRWSRPAGLGAILGAIAIQAGLFIGGAALAGDSTSERLLDASTGDSDGQLLAGVVISALGFLLLAIPLTLLFVAARDRSPRVIRQFIALSLIGVAMIATGLVLNNSSYLSAADDFAASEAARSEAAAPTSSAAEAGQAAEGGKAGEQKPAPAPEQAATGSAQQETTVEATTTQTETGSGDQGSSEDDADERADDALADAPGAAVAALLVRGGALVLSIGLFYTSLWAMRTGLLSRFWGSLGMASAVVLALFFLYFFALIWFLAMGLMLIGAWMGGRPPAWETGIATPWPTRKSAPGPGPDDTVEGSGRELPGGSAPGGGDPDAPDAPGAGDELGAGSNGANGGGPDEPPPRKRKRRR